MHRLLTGEVVSEDEIRRLYVKHNGEHDFELRGSNEVKLLPVLNELGDKHGIKYRLGRNVNLAGLKYFVKNNIPFITGVKSGNSGHSVVVHGRGSPHLDVPRLYSSRQVSKAGLTSRPHATTYGNIINPYKVLVPYRK